MIADSSPVQTGQIRTEFVAFVNSAGWKLAACVEHAGGNLAARPWVVLAPKYGETKKNNLQMAYFLAANGCNVLRFDHSNHIGESEGQMEDFTMTGAVDDIVACLDFLESSAGVSGVVLVSNSLSARSALRAAVCDSRIKKVVSVVGVVNLQHTLREVYKEDIFGTYLEGRHWGITDILGFDINGETFLGTAVEANLHDLKGTVEDVARLSVPLVYFFAENDTWVDIAQVRQVLGQNPFCRLVSVAGAMHEVRENPRAAEEIFRQVAWVCWNDTACPADAEKRLQVPDKKMVLAQNKVERERMRRSELPAQTENDFWSGYLERYSVLEKSNDYRQYLQDIGGMCSVRPGFTVLDAGCGNGMFGMWVLHDAVTRGLAGATMPPVYVGLDLTVRGLTDALENHDVVRRKHLARTLRAGITPGVNYSQFDFNELTAADSSRRLPFADGTFDVVCCSLVLSYLRQPALLLRELYRVARPGAVFVTSSMKPHCDMSVIYRDFIEQQVTAKELESARDLLRAAGKIRLKEEIGHYAFYSQEELAALVNDAGFRISESRHSLGNQAVVVKAVR